jgi:tetratricopeptide (TPR) repeat protein
MHQARQTIPLLEAALRESPSDWKAWEMKAKALEMVGRCSEALAAAQTILDKIPEHETALVLAGRTAVKLGHRDAALAYWRRAVAMNPWMADYRANLVLLLADKKAWDEVGSECQEWRKLDPASISARKTWVEYLLRTGRPEQARMEFTHIAALNPPDLSHLQAWFAKQTTP